MADSRDNWSRPRLLPRSLVRSPELPVRLFPAEFANVYWPNRIPSFVPYKLLSFEASFVEMKFLYEISFFLGRVIQFIVRRDRPLRPDGIWQLCAEPRHHYLCVSEWLAVVCHQRRITRLKMQRITRSQKSRRRPGRWWSYRRPHHIGS